MSQLFTGLLVQLLLLSCSNNPNVFTIINNDDSPTLTTTYKQINKIPLPAGFERETADSTSFTYYLRNIGLKKDKTVYLYNGQPKSNQSAQFAVLDISTGDKDLQQCADATIRLRAEYLFAQRQFGQIVYYDNDKVEYKFTSPFTRYNFSKYLTRVFGMCGSASLAKQLKPVGNFENIQAGDVIIRGGFPGHAVIVMDVAINATGNKIYLLAQSYMPAQDIHVLINPANNNLSPWYEVNDNQTIHTPEFTFTKNELMKW